MSSALEHWAVRAWLAHTKLRRRLGRNDVRARWAAIIDRHAPGRSFLDIGGMWGIDGEVAFRADAAGATRTVLCDAMEPTPEFLRRKVDAGVEYVHGDLHDPATIAALGSFDVVWCAGVLYHTPQPWEQLRHLRQLTRETLLLGTRIIPEIPGLRGGAVFYPALEDHHRRAVAWAFGDEAAGMLAAARPFDPAAGYGNYWWGLSASAVQTMVELSGFEMLEAHRPDPVSLELVARAR